MKRALVTTVVLAAVLAMPARLRTPAQTQSQTQQIAARHTPGTGSYNLLIASGFVCDPTSADDCPAVARSDSGATVEISGVGSLDVDNKSVSAAGTFTQKTLAGAIVMSGIWIATALVSFQSYGIDPGAMLRDYPQVTTAGVLPVGGAKMGVPLAALLDGPLAAGGLAVIRIRLLPDVGSPEDALLRVNCARGKVPEAEQTDGVKLAITSGPSFEEQVSGRTILLLRRLMPHLAPKEPPK
jgi:hypothetical protein